MKQKKLGSDSFGFVHFARHGSSTQNVVVKKLKNTCSLCSPDDFLRFVEYEVDFSSVANLLPVCFRDILTGLD